MNEADIKQLLRDNPPARKFVPYCFLSDESGAFTCYFEGDPDYSVVWHRDLTVYRSLATDEPVGFRIEHGRELIDFIRRFIPLQGEVPVQMLLLGYAAKADEKLGLSTLSHGVAKHGLKFSVE